MLEESRNILWVPVFLGLGIALYFSLSFEPSLFLVSIITVMLALISFKVRGLIPFFIISAGVLVAGIRVKSIDTIMINEPYKNLVLTGKVKNIEEKPLVYRLILEDVKTSLTFPSKIQLNLPKSLVLPKLGDVVDVVANVLPYSGPVSPRGYDFKRQAFFQGSGAVGRIESIRVIAESSPNIITTGRYNLTNALKQSIGGVEGEIAAALITGERSSIPEGLRQSFTDAGLAHLLAISGLHFGLVAALVFLLFRRSLALIPFIAESYNIKKIAAVIVMPTMVSYLLISGMGIPAQRAFIMISIIMLGIFVDRQALSMRLLAIAAFLILLVRPESLLSASFQLSFAAVAALIAAYERGWAPLRDWSKSTNSRFSWRVGIAYLVGVIATTTIATIATTPLTLYMFNRFTLQSILGNLLAIPLTGVLIMPALLLSIFSLFFGGWSWCFLLVKKSIALLIQIATYVAALPGAAITVPTPPELFLWMTTLGGLWFCLWQKPWRWWGAGVFVCGFFTLLFPSPMPVILVAGDKSVIAYPQGDTLYVSDLKRGQFHTEMWRRELGLSSIAQWESPIIERGEALLIADVRGAKYKIRPLILKAKFLISTSYLDRFRPKKPTYDRSNITSSLFFFETPHELEVISNEPKHSRVWR